ncbi:MAG: outer membrane beta-barrel protein [Candidatus Omnitrophica bacterium]|nr:outer membrane beta-barrel protein [Candidatus Omnitrophota bacterium]
MMLCGANIAFAEEGNPALKNKEGMDVYLDNYEGRQKAIESSFKEAQLKTLEESLPEAGSETLANLLRYWHPYLEIETRYEDNIYLTPSRSSDIINIYTPGIRFLSLNESDRYELNTGAKLTSFYHKWFNNSQDPFISIWVDKKLGRNYVKLDEEFSYNTTPNSSIVADTVGFNTYQYNFFNIKVGREMNLFSIEPSVTRYDYFYRKDFKKNNSYNETIPSLTGYYQFAPKTSLLFEYDHGIVRYPKKPSPSKDNRYEQFWFGVKGDITAKINGFMKAGYQFRKFNNGGDWDKPVVGFDLSYQFKERTSILLKLLKTSAQTDYSNQNYYERNRLDLGVVNQFAFNPKLVLKVDSFYENDDFPSPTDPTSKERMDNLFGVSTSLKYDLQRWFSTLLKYEWKEDYSNVDSYTYVDHIMSIKFVGTF